MESLALYISARDVFRFGQACYNCAMKMNAHGRGVQIPRRTCFAEACRALFPDGGLIPEVVQKAMSGGP